MKDFVDINDLGFAAWLKTHGVKLERVERGSKSFIFALSQGETDKMKMDYINSCCSKQDTEVRLLRRLI